MGNAFVDKLARLTDLSEADVAALVHATGSGRPVVARQDFIREGDPPGPVFAVLEGWACRYKVLPSGGRQIMAFLVPGDCCDLHVGLLREMDHSIQAVTGCQVATISRTSMDELMDGHPNIARAMYLAQLVDEGVLRSWIVSLGRRTSIERVAHLMCELFLRIAAPIDIGQGEVMLPLSQVVLADALGMTPVHINRVLRELRLSGAMELRRGCLIVKDPLKLVETAGFDENYLHRRLRQGINYR